MPDYFLDPSFWAALFSVTLIQIALGADNLIVITILANKLPLEKQALAVRVGLGLAAVFRIILLGLVSWLLTVATGVFATFDFDFLGLHFAGAMSGKAVILVLGGFVLIWKGVKELRTKMRGGEHAVEQTADFGKVVAIIVGMNLLFSVVSILSNEKMK